MKRIFSKNKISKPLAVAVAAAFWLLVWQIISMIIANESAVPTPLNTFKKFAEMIITGEFWISALMTFLRVLIGTAISFVLGLAGAVLAYRFGIVRAILSGISNFFKATPVMSVIMFLMIAVIAGAVPIVLCVFMCFPVFYTNILEGFDSLENEYKEMADEFTGSLSKQIRYVFLPLSKPHIKSSISLACGLGWKSVVAAEVLASPGISMGEVLAKKKSLGLTDELIAWTFGIVILSVLFTYILKKLLK